MNDLQATSSRVKSIIGLQILFGHKLTDDAVEIYLTALSLLTDGEIERAIRYLSVSFEPTAARPFPVPADFFRGIGKDAGSRNQDAISKIRKAVQDHGRYASVDFLDKSLHAVVRQFGGWVAICGWGDESWQINSKQFLAAYDACVKTARVGPDHLPGITEVENSGLHNSYLPKIQIIGGGTRPMIEHKQRESESAGAVLLNDLSGSIGNDMPKEQQN